METDPATIRTVAHTIAARDGRVSCLSVHRLCACHPAEAYREMCADPELEVVDDTGMVTWFRLKERTHG